MTNHPITPPPELVDKWYDEWLNTDEFTRIANQAARWGADQELEACLSWFKNFYAGESWMPKDLVSFKAARRPKPPSLKEQALRELGDVYDKEKIDDTTYDTIKRALEALPND